MSRLKRFLLLGSIGVVLLTGLVWTSNIQGSSTAHASGCNNPAQGNTGVAPDYHPTWSNNCQISQGNISNYVIAIQEAINVSNFNTGCPYLNNDGNFGPLTKAAVVCFQKASGFPPNEQDGIVGPKTWGALAGYLDRGAYNNGWYYYAYPPQGSNNFRMWGSSGIWYVINDTGHWCQVNLSSPC